MNFANIRTVALGLYVQNQCENAFRGRGFADQNVPTLVRVGRIFGNLERSNVACLYDNGPSAQSANRSVLSQSGSISGAERVGNDFVSKRFFGFTCRKYRVNPYVY